MSQELDLKVNKLETLMEQNNKDHEEIKSAITGFSDKLDNAIDRMEKKFAPMWVKDIVVWAGSAIGLFLIGYVMVQLFK